MGEVALAPETTPATVVPPVVVPASEPTKPAATTSPDPSAAAAAAIAAKPVEPAKPASAVPERYEFKLPEGIAADDPVLASVEPMFREAGLSQAAAQKLVDKHFETVRAHEAAQGAVREQWSKELAANPEIGGANLPANRARIQQMLERTIGAENAGLLLAIGDYPPLMQVLHAFATRTSEASWPGSSNGAPAKSAEDGLRATYPTMFNLDGSPKPL